MAFAAAPRIDYDHLRLVLIEHGALEQWRTAVWTREVRTAVVVHLHDEGYSYAAMHEALGIPTTTMGEDVYRAEHGISLTQKYRGERGTNVGRATAASPKVLPFKLTTATAARQSESHKRRFVEGVNVAAGLGRGMQDIDYGKAVAAMTPEEVTLWRRELRRAIKLFTTANTNLEEASRNGEHPQ